MPKVSLASVEKASRVAPPGRTCGEVETRALFDREIDAIHLHLHRLACGADFEFDGTPTDCLVYVWKGEVEVSGVPADMCICYPPSMCRASRSRAVSASVWVCMPTRSARPARCGFTKTSTTAPRKRHSIPTRKTKSSSWPAVPSVSATALYGPGTALAVAAHTRYGFYAGPDGLSFVNFRGTSPTYASADGTIILDEAKLWRETVGKPEYVVAARA
jgi:hypothetical protein